MIKPFTRLSKQLLLDIIEYKYSYDDSVNLEPEYKDYSKCNSICPWYNFDRTSCDVCRSCPFILSTSSIKKTKKHALTYSQIKQLLLYHSLVFENNGLTIELTHEKVAEMIGCTVKTARDNIAILEKAGFIATSNRTFSTYIAFVINYHKYHKGNNRGYLYVNDTSLKAILNCNDINSLRLALYCTVRLDDMKKTNSAIKVFTYESLINLLPSYIYCKKQIKEIFYKLYTLFNIKFDKDTVSICNTKNTDNDIARANIKKSHKKALAKFIKKFNLNTSKKDKEDLLQMSEQYNINTVLNGLYFIKDKSPKEIGSYLRTVIRKNLSYLINTSLNLI